MSILSAVMFVTLRLRSNLLRVLTVLGGFLLAGCVASGSKTGVVIDTGSVDEIKIILPRNAPTIWRSYYVNSEVLRKDAPSEHFGIDILADSGTPVIAADAGKVVGSYFEPMYGHHVVIQHDQDEGGSVIHTRYLHLSERYVERGTIVERGQKLGTMGMTGLLAVGLVHLHFEVAREGDDGTISHVNPHLYWVGGPGHVTCFDDDESWPDKPFRATYPVPCETQ